MREIRWESKRRYYTARLSQDLLGDWVIERAWGGLFNQNGNTTQEVAGSYREAVTAMVRLNKERRARAGCSGRGTS